MTATRLTRVLFPISDASHTLIREVAQLYLSLLAYEMLNDHKRQHSRAMNRSRVSIAKHQNTRQLTLCDTRPLFMKQ
jgi:hypothetical protein